MSMQSIMAKIALVIFFSALVGYAEDWPQWHGPNRDNVSGETGLLQSWPEGGPRLLWQATGLGSAHSTVAVVGQRIYATGEIDGSSYAHALHFGDDKPVWSTPIGKAGSPGWGSYKGPRATPTVDGDFVFVLGQYGELLCLKAQDGSKVWEAHMIEDLGGKQPEWGYSESILVDGDQVVCTPGGSKGTIAALDKQTGKFLWQTRDVTDPAHYASIVCADIAGVKQYVQLTNSSVIGVDPDGRLLWRAERKGKTAVIPTPIVKGNQIYVASGYRVGSALFNVSMADGQFSVEQVYATKTMVNHHGGVLRVGDYLYGYCDSMGWLCQSWTTGEPIWAEKGQVGKGSLTYADGCLYLRSESKGTVALIAATSDGYKEFGRFVQPDLSRPKTWAHPVVADKKLYLRDQDKLLCYDVAAN